MKGKILIGTVLLNFCLVISANAQTPCSWQRITKISNKILNDKKIRKGIFEERNEQMSAIGFGADTLLKDIAFTDNKNGWITGGAGIFLITRNGGLSWRTKNIKSEGLRGIFFLDKQRGWTVGRNNKKIAVYDTDNGGKTWKLTQPIQKYELSDFAQIRFVNSQTGWAIGVTERPGSDTAIFKTIDGGKNWELQYSETSQQDGSMNFSDVEAIDENKVIVIGDKSLLKTEDGGKTWRKVYHFDQLSFFSDIEFVSKTEGWIVGLANIILHTTDGGETWTKQEIKEIDSSIDTAYNAVKFINQREGWIAGWRRDLSDEGIILHTTDSGKNWKIEKKEKNLIIQKMTATSQSLFAVGIDGLILKRNIKACS